MISVVVPAYNAGLYLRECLDSIMAQTHTDYEVVVVDDGSTDSTAAIADEYAARYPHVRVCHMANRGVSYARNHGATVARGEYITFVDADDMIHPACLETLAGMLVDNGADVSVCAMTDRGINHTSTVGTVSVIDTDTAIELTLYQRQGMVPALWGKLWPRQAVLDAPESVGLRYEDLDAFYRLYEAARGRVAVTTAPLYYYRVNASSFINTFTPARLDVLTVVDRIERHYAGDTRLLRAARDRKFSANYNMLLLCGRAGHQQQADDCWQVVKSYRLSSLTNSRVRLKNRVGALVSYLGRGIIGLLGRG